MKKHDFFRIDLDDRFISFHHDKGKFNIFDIRINPFMILYMGSIISVFVIYFVLCIVYFIERDYPLDYLDSILFYFLLFGHIYVGFFLGYFFNIFDKQIEYNLEKCVFVLEGREYFTGENKCNFRTCCFYHYVFFWPYYSIGYLFISLFNRIKKIKNRIPKYNCLVKNKYRKNTLRIFYESRSMSFIFYETPFR